MGLKKIRVSQHSAVWRERLREIENEDTDGIESHRDYHQEDLREWTQSGRRVQRPHADSFRRAPSKMELDSSTRKCMKPGRYLICDPMGFARGTMIDHGNAIGISLSPGYGQALERCRSIGVKVFFLIVLVAPRLGFAETDRGGSSRQEVLTIVRAPGVSATRLKDIGKIVLLVSSDATIATQLCEDIFATQLSAAGIVPVSREALDRATLQPSTTAKSSTESANDETEDNKENDERPDLLDIAKSLEANAVIRVTVLIESITRNIYDKDTMKPQAVHTEQAVRSLSVSVIDLNKGDILATGFQTYSVLRPLGSVVAEASKQLARELRGE